MSNGRCEHSRVLRARPRGRRAEFVSGYAGRGGAGYIRDEFPEKARDIDIAAFADGHINGYSVVAEVFANMTEAKRLIDAAWDKIFTLGQEPVEIMREVSRKVEEAQERMT